MEARRRARPLRGNDSRRRCGERLRARCRPSGSRGADHRVGAARHDGAGGGAATWTGPARNGAGTVGPANGAGTGHSDASRDRRGGVADASGRGSVGERLGWGEGPVPDRQPSPGTSGRDRRGDAVPGTCWRDTSTQCCRDAMVGAVGGLNPVGRGSAGAAFFFRHPAAATWRGRTEDLDTGVGS